jgi:uncharacterized membrane protein YkvA (DUF1232 family)
MENKNKSTLQNPGMFKAFMQRLRLTWNLLWDPRISIVLKAISILTAGYIISPVDLIPAALFGPLGALDDIGVLFLGMNVFFMLIPPIILQEHMARLNLSGPVASEDDIVDSTAEILDE